MTPINLLQIFIFLAALIAAALPLGGYMAKVYEGKPVWLTRIFGFVENGLYRILKIKPQDEMRWIDYATAVLFFNIIGIAVVYFIQRMQAVLPLNPMHLGNVAPDLAINTAISFATNTNWQSYAGETTLTYFTQMFALTAQNFLSAATGMAVLAALVRGFVLKSSRTIGNFWVDLVRGVLYILLPLAFVLSLLLVSQGVVQTFAPAVKTSSLQSGAELSIPRGPAASQVAIKQLGTNGGGYFNVNSAHPLENPTALSNFLEMLAILLIPAALCFTFGAMAGDRRQGWALFSAMLIIFIPCLLAVAYCEQKGNPRFTSLGVDSAATSLQPGGNMEGKEARFGIVNSSIWAVATTAASNGSVNAMHDSFMPLSGMVVMWLMLLGEVIFGGVGSGLYGLLAFVIIAVFISGLMIGRTPEYLGKKIEAYEMKMAALVILIPAFLVLVFTAVAVVLPAGRSAVLNSGPHGFSEILYAFSSAGNNNGSAFAGLSANNVFYNLMLAFAMFFARYWLIIPVLAIAGSLAAKKSIPVSAGTLPTHNFLFVMFLVAVVLIVGALTFFPALALGPLAEHLMMAGKI